jgi:hypothetical protein
MAKDEDQSLGALPVVLFLEAITSVLRLFGRMVGHGNLTLEPVHSRY